jgi:Vacuolar protein sorting-associated protein 26
MQQIPEINSGIKMEVGIEDCLHIEFEYNRSKYHLKDVVIGKIFFLLVRIKIKHMEVGARCCVWPSSRRVQLSDRALICCVSICDACCVCPTVCVCVCVYVCVCTLRLFVFCVCSSR